MNRNAETLPGTDILGDLRGFQEAFSMLETPFYFYHMDWLENTLSAMEKALPDDRFRVHYALKANANLPILERMVKRGLGADCVSGNEITRAVQAGFSDILFTGLGKTDKEIATALSSEVAGINVESFQELEVLEGFGSKSGKDYGFGLRINPDVDAHTHRHVTTGREENKFGIPWKQVLSNLDRLKQISHGHFLGIHTHIGSQITDISRFDALAEKINEMVESLENEGFSVPVINVGGGLGVNYEDPISDSIPAFEAFFNTFLNKLNLTREKRVHFELGRSLVAHCGVLVTRVLFVKGGYERPMLVLDGGMSELIRPALYESVHKIVNLSSQRQPASYDVVGPICESSDRFGGDVSMGESRRGDMVCILSSGAYGEAMANNYNLRDRVKAYYSTDFK